jgi:p-aminobenzoyl-glutamate transporter AbgT
VVITLISVSRYAQQNGIATIPLVVTLLFMPFIIIGVYYYRTLTRGENKRDIIGKLQSGELGVTITLALVSIFSYLVCYFGISDILWSFQHNSFGPSETVDLIAAISGLTVGVGTSIAAIIKACALFLHAQADVVRAQEEAKNAAVMRDAISSGKHELNSGLRKRPRKSIT